MSYKLYKNIVGTDAFGIATKIKEIRKPLKKKRNGRNR